MIGEQLAPVLMTFDFKNDFLKLLYPLKTPDQYLEVAISSRIVENINKYASNDDKPPEPLR